MMLFGAPTPATTLPGTLPYPTSGSTSGNSSDLHMVSSLSDPFPGDLHGHNTGDSSLFRPEKRALSE